MFLFSQKSLEKVASYIYTIARQEDKLCIGHIYTQTMEVAHYAVE